MDVGVVIGALVLAVLHGVGGRLRSITYIPRSGWLSFAGGVSVAYVFVHLLPEVARGAEIISQELEDVAFAERVAWLLALAGLGVFYWLETVTRRSRGHIRGASATTPGTFWLSLAFYAVYNSIIGYLLHHRAEAGVAELTVFVIAIGLHLLANDFALREHHKQRYERFGRWILIVAIALGAGTGLLTDIPEVVLVSTLSVIAGAVVLNVLKEELPSEVESRFAAFAAGLGGYALLLLAL